MVDSTDKHLHTQKKVKEDEENSTEDIEKNQAK